MCNLPEQPMTVPEFQNPSAAVDPQEQAKMDSPEETPLTETIPTEKHPWPASLPGQVAAIAQTLADSATALSETEIADRFTGKGSWKKRLPHLLETLVALGRARMVDDRRYGASG
jgi:hypothetical protein